MGLFLLQIFIKGLLKLLLDSIICAYTHKCATNIVEIY